MKFFNFAVIATAIIVPNLVLSQIPKEQPHPVNNSPIDLSQPADIILYIVLPIICVILYFIWRNKKKKKS